MDASSIDRPENFDKIDKFIDKLKQKKKPNLIKVKPFKAGISSIKHQAKAPGTANSSFVYHGTQKNNLNQQ